MVFYNLLFEINIYETILDLIKETILFTNPRVGCVIISEALGFK